MYRRTFVASMAAVAAARTQLLAANAKDATIGICTFSCHLHWQAVRNNKPGTAFSNARSFYDYARTLGAGGVQTSFREMNLTELRALRKVGDQDGSYLEGDIPVPKSKVELAKFEREVELTRESGATVARATLMGGRRYEVFHSMEDFIEFHQQTRQRLEWIEPILRRHGLKLAIENHKDLTLIEQLALLKQIDSEWIGALVDTGNNIALLDEPYSVIEKLAPYAMSVHFKDMAVQPDPSGFLLSEISCGTGMLDLTRIITTLRKSNPKIVFNLEMATRDPLKVPCLTDDYWKTFPDRRATHLEAAMRLVQQFPIKQRPPTIVGKSLDRQLADEETNNRQSLKWMRGKL